MAGFDDAEEAVLLSPRGRKRKRKPEEHDRKLAKNARHSGGANAAVACVHNNVNVCQAAKLSPEDIDYIHHTLYTTTDKVKQDATLLSYMDVTAVKRRRSKIEDSAQQKSRDLTVKYSVLTRARDRIPVCKSSFMSLFCVKKDRLCNIAKFWKQNGVPMPERRGGARRSEERAAKREAIREHIQTFTCRASHYARRGAPGRKYLPVDLNVRKIHELFHSQNEQQISYALYYSVFMYDFNLGFGHPAKDVCSTCIKSRLKLKDPEMSDEEKRKEAALFMLHRRKARKFYDCLNAVSDTYTVSFDMMQNLVLPKSAIGQTYYSRQLYQYVFGVVRHRGCGAGQKKEDVHLYTWLENENKKDSNMVASALQHYLSRVACNELSHHKELRLFSDSCYGQNKNVSMLAMLFSLKKATLKNVRVEYTFPVRGHSFMPPDRVFGRLEQEVKKNDTILLPSEYVTIMEKHGNVHVYGQHWECYDFKAAAAKHCTSSRSFKISEAKVLEISGDKVGFKPQYGGDFCYHSLLKRGKRWETFKPALAQRVNCVKAAKKADVLKLLGELGVGDAVTTFYTDALVGAGCDAGRQDLVESSDGNEE
ncbi:unnamed protein product [Knipowitschia caucasica]